jgi:hypothetical protein
MLPDATDLPKAPIVRLLKTLCGGHSKVCAGNQRPIAARKGDRDEHPKTGHGSKMCSQIGKNIS